MNSDRCNNIIYKVSSDILRRCLCKSLITVKYPVDALKGSSFMYVLTRVCIMSDYMRLNKIE